MGKILENESITLLSETTWDDCCIFLFLLLQERAEANLKIGSEHFERNKKVIRKEIRG